LYRKLRDENPCSNDQSGSLKLTGKMTSGRYKEYKCKKKTEKKSHRIEMDGRRQLSEPEACTACSASKDEEVKTAKLWRKNEIFEGT
jgi:hypothetical protein